MHDKLHGQKTKSNRFWAFLALYYRFDEVAKNRLMFVFSFGNLFYTPIYLLKTAFPTL